MIIMGVDPGLLNVGVAVYDTVTRKPLYQVTLSPAHIPPKNWLGRVRWILNALGLLVEEHKPGWFVVETMVWQGKRRGVLPLAQAAGAILGFLFAHGPVTGVVPSKVKERSRGGNGKTPHEVDALSLCRLFVNNAHKNQELAVTIKAPG